jgi:uncharacterized membrane protein YhaH (DUF805 family)
MWFILNTAFTIVVFILTAHKIRIFLFLITRNFTIIQLCLSFYLYLLYLPFISATTRRIHDFDGENIITVLNLIPIVNFITIIIFGCIRGDPEPNVHGYPRDINYQVPLYNPYDYQEMTNGQEDYQEAPYPINSPGSWPYPDQRPPYWAEPYPGAPPRPGDQPAEKASSLEESKKPK